MRKLIPQPVRKRLGPLRRAVRDNPVTALRRIARSGLWDADWFRQQYPAHRRAPNALLLFARQASSLALSPHPLFDTCHYLRTHPDVAAAGSNPLTHYLQAGAGEGRNPNPVFDGDWYYRHYPDVAASGMNPLCHFVLWGEAEGRDPHPLFQTQWYREQYRDCLHECASPLADYLHGGEETGRQPNPWFDPAYYRQQLPPDTDIPDGLLAHYLSRGADMGLDPSPAFSTREYLDDHPDIALRGINPLVHHLRGAQDNGLADWPERGLDDGDWYRLFGRLTNDERLGLQEARPDLSSEDVLVVRADTDKATPVWIADAEGPSKVSVTDTTEAVRRLRASTAYRAVLIVAARTRIDPDALLLGQCVLGSASDNAVYFDELAGDSAHDAAALALRLKPDWSPGLFAIGGMPHAMMMLPATKATADSLATLGIDGILAHAGTNATRERLHVPVIGCHTTGPAVPRVAEASSFLPEPLDARLVSIVIPTRDRLDLLQPCIESLLQKTDYPHFEVIVIDNGSREKVTREYLRTLEQRENCRVVRWNRRFNFSQVCNVGARHARGELLCLLNNDMEVHAPDWLSRMVATASAEDCGVVGAMLHYPDGRIQHAGVLMGPGGVAANRFAGCLPEVMPEVLRNLPHEVSAVAGACLLTPISLYRELGGLDEEALGVAFNDVDYCLRVRQHGLWCRLEPRAVLVHAESASLKNHGLGRARAFGAEIATMQQRWAEVIARDPFHNINLDARPEHAHRPAFSNRRGPWLRAQGLQRRAAMDMDALHPPLRWYQDSNQTRVQAVHDANARTPPPAMAIHPKDGLAVVILTKDRPEYILPLIDQLAAAQPVLAAQGLPLHVVIGDTGTRHRRVLRRYRELPEGFTLRMDMAYHFSQNNNALLDVAGQFSRVLFLNNDIAFTDAAASLKTMVQALDAEADIGIVGPLLCFPDGRVQHEGIAAFTDGPLRGFVHHPNAHGAATLASGEARDVLAVTGAALLIRAEALRACGGFDGAYMAECQDVDLCLSAARAGYRSRVLHAGDITHFENGTRRKGDESWADRRRLMRRWHHWIEDIWL